jgi:hypothetical protein
MDSVYQFIKPEIELLKDMASRCPAIEGNAVTMARTLLYCALHDNTVYEDFCDFTTFSSRKAKPKTSSSNLPPDYTQKLIVYPNPSNGDINLILDNEEQGELIILDLQNKPVYTTLLKANITALDISFLAVGIYTCKLKTALGNWVIQKLVIRK